MIFLAIDFDNIVNSSVPMGSETDGYQVEIRTKDADGELLEVISSMPFFISGGGTSSLNVTIGGVTSGHNGTVGVFVDSPVTGPMKKIATFTDATSTVVNFINIPDGQYYFFTQPIVTLGSTDYSGFVMPEPITVSGTTNKTVNLTQEAAGAGKATITVNITAELGTDDIDVFAGSPTTFKVKH